MKLSETLLIDCEEFFDAIGYAIECPKLIRAIEGLRYFLERDVDGWTNHTNEVLARAVQCRLTEIWSHLNEDEDLDQGDLSFYYRNLLEELEDYSGFESEDDEDSEEEA